ncbi:MAG: hypothetical protein RR400_02795 [Clostridia bacterium]
MKKRAMTIIEYLTFKKGISSKLKDILEEIYYEEDSGKTAIIDKFGESFFVKIDELVHQVRNGIREDIHKIWLWELSAEGTLLHKSVKLERIENLDMGFEM